MGWTAAARRMVSGPTSERPMCGRSRPEPFRQLRRWFLHGTFRVEARGTVDVDVPDAEALERIGERGLDCGGRLS